MKTIIRKKKVTLALLCGVVFAIFAVAVSVKTLACTLDTLSSPPSSMFVKSQACNGTGACNRSSTTIFTLSNAGPCGHTWTFTNTTTGCQKVFTTAGGVGTLQVFIPGSTGDNITLVISDDGGGSGPTYNMTGVSC
jgi:hypothetical protein